MISLKKSFLFVHIPKTGGNSIQSVLAAFSDDEIVATKPHQDGVERFNVRNRRYGTNKHATLADYRAALEREVYAGLFKFAVIRNPWDWLVSWYFSPRRLLKRDLAEGAPAWDREAFLGLLDEVPTFRHYLAAPTLGQRLAETTGLRRPAPLDGDVDALLRFEHLDEDFQAVCRRLDIPPVPLPVRNRSARGPYAEYYDDELAERVREKFHEVIAYGGYTFDAATSAPAARLR